MNKTLSISQLTSQYEQQTVLKSLSLSVDVGEIICLLGASGCGKTTLLKAIAGLLPISTGSIYLNGKKLDDGAYSVVPEKRNIGMIFQDYALFPHLSVAQNIEFGLRDLSPTEKRERVEEMLSLVRLQGYGDRYPHQLSGGQQQRIAIARSLAYRPDLLLLDEPFSNIDTQVRHQLIREIREIFKRHSVTAIFVTHNSEEAFAFADKMAVMNQGVIEQFGSASELYHQPSSLFVADFLGGGSYLPAIKIAGNNYQTSLGRVEARSPFELDIDQECLLLLRPQDVTLQANIDSKTQIIEHHFMGDHYRYIIDIDGHSIVATASQRLSVGDRVEVSIAPQGLTVFPNQ